MNDTGDIDWTIVFLIIVAVIVAALVLIAIRKKPRSRSLNEVSGAGNDERFVVDLADDYVSESLGENDEVSHQLQEDNMVEPAETAE